MFAIFWQKEMDKKAAHQMLFKLITGCQKKQSCVIKVLYGVLLLCGPGDKRLLVLCGMGLLHTT